MYRILIILSFLLVISWSSPAIAEDRLVVLQTQSGNITIELFADEAPMHVQNFIELVEEGFYDRTVFHRIIKDFMIQGGDPLTKPGAYISTDQWGTGDPGYTIDAEFNTIKHNRGIVSMARSNDPNSAGSQFFITHADANFLDGQYTVFGRIVTQESFDTLDTIANLETGPGDIPLSWGDAEIIKAAMVQRSEVSDLLQLGPPERTDQIISANVPYVNDKLGISVMFPTGWLVQEPTKIQPDIPDIVAVSPVEDGIPPAFTLSIEYTNDRTLDEFVDTIKRPLRPLVDSGEFKITDEGSERRNDRDSYMINVEGITEVDNTTTEINFRQVIFRTSDKFYTFTYTTTKDKLEDNLDQFEQTLNSFTILSQTADDSVDSNQGGCLIATAAYGSELAKPIQQLRELRDNTLLKTSSGAAFMAGFNQIYYSFSPTIADWQRENPIFKQIVKISITPMINTLSLLNYAEIDSESKMVGYGMAVIMTIIGLYTMLPAAVLYTICKRH